jgi:hypothetical protein
MTESEDYARLLGLGRESVVGSINCLKHALIKLEYGRVSHLVISPYLLHLTSLFTARVTQ